MENLCNKFKVSTCQGLLVSYSIPGHPNVILEDDEDLECMFGILLSMGLKHIDVSITYSTNDVNQEQYFDVGGSSSTTNVNSDVDVGIGARRLEWITDTNRDNDLLASFWQHEHLLFSDC